MPQWITPNGGMRPAREGYAAPTMGLAGWSLGDEGAMPVDTRGRDAVAVADRGAAPFSRVARRISRAVTVGISFIGAAAGAAVLGYFARETGHPTVDVARIACMGAVAGASLGAALIPAIRALAWSVVVTAIAAAGAGALWFVHRLDPLLLRNIFERLW